MKTKHVLTFAIAACLICIFALSGCKMGDRNLKENEKQPVSKENDEKDYYSIEDFSSLTVGKSTIHDVLSICPNFIMSTTYYGGYSTFPKEDGGYILIKFYEGDLTIGSIEEIPAETNPQ